MFMSGADGKTAELRPSEFKGMMRWWWRAIKAEDNIEKLREEEAKIFGGTGEGEGKSKIRLRLIYQNLQTGSNLKQDFRLDWSYDKSTRSLTGRDRGIGYLLYSTVLPNRVRSFFNPGEKFEIIISSVDENSLKKSVASFWLAIYLGGFGARSRRGGGNIEVISVDRDMRQIDFLCKAKDQKELWDWLKNNLDKIKDILKQSNSKTNKYTNLKEKDAKILIFEGKNDWKAALNFLGEEYVKFRKKNIREIYKTAAFGMPVMHNQFRMVPYENENKNLSDRWASSLIFKIIKSNHLYFPVVVKMSAGGVPFIGKEKKEGRDWKLDDNQIQRFDEMLVNEFLNSLPNKMELSYE